MRFKVRQKQIEQKVFDAIEDIAEELNVSFPHYPEVYWIGKSAEFEYLGLSERYRGDFENRKKDKGSVYLRIPHVILLTKDCPTHIGEESAHFLHLVNSKIKLTNKNKSDWATVNMLIEMFGFFGSKIICPERENPYSPKDDLVSVPSEEVNRYREIVNEVYGGETGCFEEYLIHQQGYCLAEKMFENYRAGILSKKYIRQIFLKRFDKPHSATTEFLKLRKNFWPQKN